MSATPATITAQSVQAAKVRLATYYLNKLKNLDALCAASQDPHSFSQQFDEEWAQMNDWQAWSVADPTDPERLALAYQFPLASYYILSFKFLRELLRDWFTQGVSGLSQADLPSQITYWQLMAISLAQVRAFSEAQNAIDTSWALSQTATISAQNQAKFYRTRAIIAQYQGDYEQAKVDYQQQLTLLDDFDDEPQRATCLYNLSSISGYLSEYTAAKEYAHQAVVLLTAHKNWRQLAGAWENLGLVSHFEGDHASAIASLEKALAYKKQLGYHFGVAATLTNLGFAAIELKDSALSQAYFEQSLALCLEINDDNGAAINQLNLGKALLAQGDYTSAAQYMRQSLAIQEKLDDKFSVASCIQALAELAFEMGQFETAQTHLEQALALMEEMNHSQGVLEVSQLLVRVHLAQEQPSLALSRCRQLLQVVLKIDTPPAYLATLAVATQMADSQLATSWAQLVAHHEKTRQADRELVTPLLVAGGEVPETEVALPQAIAELQAWLDTIE